jgi:hypothetical protein
MLLQPGFPSGAFAGRETKDVVQIELKRSLETQKRRRERIKTAPGDIRVTTEPLVGIRLKPGLGTTPKAP